VRERERERKYIKDYIVLSSMSNILKEAFIYRDVMSSDQETLDKFR
jgi:hypothetical protein